ncbi:MAG: FMN-binding protein, partial [Bacteroidales bacterium]|nr:FMN-binding protein [Bacteroidales bacterium]
KGLDTNGNAYTIIYSTVIVVVVAFLLAFVVSALKPQQDANVKIDTMQHKLNALNIRGLDKAVVEEKFNDLKIGEEVMGDVTVEEFAVDGSTKYLVPVSGRGLWGGIWGFIALDDDLNTIYGTDFQHESETAGLGALIAEQPFQDSFRGKKVFAEGASEVTLSVVKKGKQGDLAPENYVDGITGATLTSNGVDAMLKECLIKVVKTNAEAEHDCANHKDGEPCTSPNPCEKCKQQMGK